MQRRSASRIVAFCLLGMATGAVLITVPAASRVHHFSIFELARQAIEHLSWLVLGLLLLMGVVWGIWLDRFEALVTALAQPAILPLIAIVQIVQDPTSHNLWPLEFMIYAFMGGLGLAGAWIGSAVGRVVGSSASRS